MWKKLSKRLCKAAGIVALLVLCGVAIGPLLRFMRRHSPDPLSRLLEQADEKAWLNNWIDAAPLYGEAEALCIQRNNQSCALYSHVSQIPANSETASIASQIAQLSADLTLPAARDYRTRLRILGVRGMLEVNYDAGMTSATYSEIETMALRRGHLLVAARARGEQGIADFLTGNIATAKKKVVYAWTVSKLFRDRAAQIRYASMYAEGLAQIGRYQEAQRAVAEAIRTPHDTPNAPYPSMAESTKVEILTQTGKYADAFKILDESEAWALSHHLEGHLCAAEINRGDLWNRMGKTNLAIVSYRRALEYADHLSFWRGFTSTGGSLAIDMAEISDLTSWTEIVESMAYAAAVEDPSFAGLSATAIACLEMPFGDVPEEKTISTVLKHTPRKQAENIVDRLNLAIAVESPIESRERAFATLSHSATQSGLAAQSRLMEAETDGSDCVSRPNGTSNGPFNSARTLGEIRQILATPAGKADAHSAGYAVERIAEDCDYEELKQFLEQESGVSVRERLIDSMARRAHALGRMKEFQTFLERLEALTEDRGSWGGAWNGDAKQRLYSLRRDTGDATASTEAFAQFANDMAAGRESTELILPELCDLLDIFSPKIQWEGAWDCLAEHLREYREFKLGADLTDRTDLGSSRCDLIADLLYRAYETTSIPLIQMARTAAIECASRDHGPEVLAILISRLWDKASLFQNEAAQILWETRNLRELRDLVESYLPKMTAETDFGVWLTGVRISAEWGVPILSETVPLPPTYSLSIPCGPGEERFEPPIGVSESSSGVITENFRDWTWSLEGPLKLVSEASAIDLSTLRYRAGILMLSNRAVSPFDASANAAQMTKLKKLTVHTGYWKLMTAAAYRAMREVAGELMAAGMLDPAALPLLRVLTGGHSLLIPTVSPVWRPEGFKTTRMPEPFGRTEMDREWVQRVSEDQVVPSFSGWFPLAATSTQQRSFREEQWTAEQWWGPGAPIARKSLDDVLEGLPLTVVDFGVRHQSRPEKGAILRPMVPRGDFQEKELLFCPVLAKELGLKPDSADAFRYVDHEGNTLVATIQWREGGIHAEESETSCHRFGSAVLVASSLKGVLLSYLPAVFTLTSWRRHENPPQKVESLSASEQFPQTEL